MFNIRFFYVQNFSLHAEYRLQVIYDQQKCKYGNDNSNGESPSVTITSASEFVFSFKISWLHKIPFLV
ncbi:hypothetical protein [Pedobacter cryoconitis]|uniref:Uncharacterized protein n=1 Tax=Pedobacter cryoconitis TaxID=188932 RepID=A0A327SKE8_9SPHI|nr:hypothetical protein [Pedobacter cryoconitis]RAJ26217.1 hypothetical protein LY11_03923 [Pedobacter cryoconitis]